MIIFYHFCFTLNYPATSVHQAGHLARKLTYLLRLTYFSIVFACSGAQYNNQAYVLGKISGFGKKLNDFPNIEQQMLCV